MSFTITYETLFDLLRKESSREDLQALPEGFYADVMTFLTQKNTDAMREGAVGHRARIEHQNTQKIIRELYDRRERKILLLALNKARTESAIIDASILLAQEKILFERLVDSLKVAKHETVGRLLTSLPASLSHTRVHEQPLSSSSFVSSSSSPTPSSSSSLTSSENASTDSDDAKEDSSKATKEMPHMRTEAQIHADFEEKHMRVKFLSPVPKFIGKDMTIFGPFNPGDESELPLDVASVLLKKGRIEQVEKTLSHS